MSKPGRPCLRINLTITSKDDERFSTPKTYSTVSEVCKETGFPNSGIISNYNAKRTNMMKRSNGFVYYFEWGEVKAPRPPRVPPKNGKICSKVTDDRG